MIRHLKLTLVCLAVAIIAIINLFSLPLPIYTSVTVPTHGQIVYSPIVFEPPSNNTILKNHGFLNVSFQYFLDSLNDCKILRIRNIAKQEILLTFLPRNVTDTSGLTELKPFFEDWSYDQVVIENGSLLQQNSALLRLSEGASIDVQVRLSALSKGSALLFFDFIVMSTDGNKLHSQSVAFNILLL